MLLFPNGLYQRRHEYILAVEHDVAKPGDPDPHHILHVLHNHNKPLRCLPSECDFICEKLIAELKAKGVKVTGMHRIDLGPVKSVFNLENKRKYVDRGYA